MVLLEIPYFEPFLKLKHSMYNTLKSQADGVLLDIPYFTSSVYKSNKYFCLSFVYESPKICNEF